VKRTLTILTTLALCCPMLAAQETTGALEFRFDERAAVAPRFGTKVEVVPVLELVGAEVAYSQSAGAWGVVLGEHVLQFAPGPRVMLVDGNLHDALRGKVINANLRRNRWLAGEMAANAPQPKAKRCTLTWAPIPGGNHHPRQFDFLQFE
jgi:hypothetical protein